MIQNTITQKNTTQDAQTYQEPFVSPLVTSFFWLLCIGTVVYLTFNIFNLPDWHWKSLLRINGFTLLMWTIVTFFSAIVSSYARNYLRGFRYQSKFMLLSLGFTLAVMLLVMSEHIGLLIFAWFLMGLFMSQLIGIDSTWGEAKEALKLTRTYFMTGTLFLTLGLLSIAVSSDQYTISGLAMVVPTLPTYLLVMSSLCVIAAAIVQSAIYPFHRWLLSAMTAPTPASALMHAGFVNGAGILLALFASLLFASNTLTLLFIIGGFTAIIAQFTKLLQVNVKQKLGCSTIAQMGFMIMQCGLGFFNAAIAHMILHGFYKAYLFLSSGEDIAQTRPIQAAPIKIKPFQAVVVLLFGIMGAYLFANLTGKGLLMDSGIFLTLIVSITVGQATYNIIKEQSLSMLQKIILPPTLFLIGIVVYASIYKGVSYLLQGIPMIHQPIPLSWTQIIFGIIFLFGFFIMKLGIYKQLPWLYVKLMNLSQPYKTTVLMYKSKTL